MFYFCLSMGIGFFSILFRMVAALRLGVPALYILLMSTVFSEWYDTHEPLADSILLAMLLCAALSWVYSVVQKVREYV